MVDTADSDGYRVAPAALRGNAQQLTAQGDQLERILNTVVGTSVPASAFGAIPQSSQAATELTDALKAVGRQIDSAGNTAHDLSTKVTECAVGYETADNAVAASYRKLLGITAPNTVTPAASAPAATGPFARQITDNRAAVTMALATEQQRLAGLLRSNGDVGAIAGSEDRIALYEDILANNRQIVAFDPSGNGKIVEQIGTIDADTRNVGVLVPGTFSSIANHETYAHTAADMVAADPNHDLAMLVYSDGRNPQSLSLSGAASPTYAQTMAPDLAAFSHQLRSGVSSDAAPGAQITYLGHSYAASTLGAAEQQGSGGLDADRIVRVEGAGEGPGIWSPTQLPDYGRTTNYSMTAPDDPIGLIQADSGLYPVVDGLKSALGLPPNAFVPAVSPHGADPDTFPRTIDLDPGYVPHNPLLPGVDVNQHTAVLKPYSPSWWNLYDVVTGQPAHVLPAR
ncbi:MAG TPA: alpha/beta hydrolase [Jatrophihabitantaceae bacterium]